MDLNWMGQRQQEQEKGEIEKVKTENTYLDTMNFKLNAKVGLVTIATRRATLYRRAQGKGGKGSNGKPWLRAPGDKWQGEAEWQAGEVMPRVERR